jgi:hypothetical protein
MKYFILLFFTACRSVSLDPQTEDLKPIVEDVRRAVNKATGSELVRVGPDVQVVWGEIGCAFASPDRKVVGLTRACQETYGDEAIRIALVHEIGHVLGLEHSSEPTSVMTPVLKKGMTLDQAATSLFYELSAKDSVLLPPNAP